MSCESRVRHVTAYGLSTQTSKNHEKEREIRGENNKKRKEKKQREEKEREIGKYISINQNITNFYRKLDIHDQLIGETNSFIRDVL